MRLLAGAVTLSFIAASCGGDDSEGAGGTETTAGGETETTAATEGGEGGEGGEAALRWRTRPDNQAEIDVYQSVSDTIDEANDGFTLTYEPGGSETTSYQDQLKTEIAAGTAPDVFWIPGTDIADFAGDGLIMNVAPMAEGFDAGAFYPEPMVHLQTDPETGVEAAGDFLWGLPRDVSTFALYINQDLIAEAGADDPVQLAADGEWTWEAFQEVSQAVTDLGGANKGFAMNAWWANFGYWMNNAGGGFFNEDRTACALDTPESVEGLSFIKGVYDAQLAVPYGDDGEAPWVAGTVGMFVNGRWATPGARASAEFNWDVAPLPAGPNGAGGNWLFWGAYVVNANTEHPEEAWQLVQSLTESDIQGSISELGANIPSRQSDDAIDAFLGFTPPENNQAFIDGISTSPVAEGPLWAGNWPDYDTAMGTAVTDVLTGARTIEDFQANVCSEVAGAFG
jgi:multiple sugar transport system substrate-binding protein